MNSFPKNLRSRAWVVFGVAAISSWLGCQTSQKNTAGAACSDCAVSATADATPATPTSSSAFVSNWLTPEDRTAPIEGFAFENQNAQKISFRDLRGAPVAMSFIYTRCQNQRKCPLVARTMAELATVLSATRTTPNPKLLLLTYDPEYDTPEHLKSFARTHGFAQADNAMLLRPEPVVKQALFSNLNVRVNYDEGGVNLHGIQLILLDKKGRYVRSYHGVLWENRDVLADLARLAGE